MNDDRRTTPGAGGAGHITGIGFAPFSERKPKYAIRVLFKSNEAQWSGDYDPSPYGPKNDGEAVEWAVRMQEGMGDMYAVTLTRDGVVMALPEPPTPSDPEDDAFAPHKLCDCVGPNEAEPQPCRCGRKP